MNNKNIIFVSFFILYLISCDIDFVGSIEEDQFILTRYPTTLKSLSNSQMEQLQIEFDLLNKNKFCSTVNKYGFLIKDSQCDVQISTMEIIRDKGYITKLAKEAIAHNYKFTNVPDTFLLEIENFIDETAGSGRVRVIFKAQVYHRLPVYGTNIEVFYEGDTTYAISFGWFKDIYVPSKPEYSITEVKNKLIGTEFTDYSASIIVTENTIKDSTITQVILPNYFTDKMELRCVYKIPLYEHRAEPSWIVYVDTQTCETVGVETLFWQ